MADQAPHNRVLVITGGSVRRAMPNLGAFDRIIAADSGVDSAIALGLTPHVVIGDLDSISEAGLRRVRELGIEPLVSPADKDLTDTELALHHAVDTGGDTIVVLSPGGGRLDHAHGLLAALTNPNFSRVNIEAVIDTAHVSVMHGPASLSVPRRGSQLLALHAMNGPAVGIITSGLRWNLSCESLHPWASRGVSNVMLADAATVTVEEGSLIVVQPNAYGDNP
ncbi:MAG: thiamine diphosphokinase [Ilumatobacteraceae bacterium]